MKNKNLLTILIVIIVTAVAMTGVTYAWFVNYQSAAYIVTGDTKISVSGKYEIGTDINSITYSNTLKSLNNAHALSPDQFVAYKFTITNETKSSTRLSVNFGDFSEYIFTHFEEYRNNYGNISSELNDLIKTTALINAAKLTLVIEDVFYVNRNGTSTQINSDTDRYLWRFSSGNRFIDNIIIGAEETIDLYFKISNIQSTATFNDYHDWLCGTSTVEGYGQTKCARILGYSYSALNSTDKTIINDYLALFCRDEFSAFNDEVEFSASLNLHLSYFEFVGESI